MVEVEVVAEKLPKWMMLKAEEDTEVVVEVAAVKPLRKTM